MKRARKPAKKSRTAEYNDNDNGLGWPHWLWPDRDTRRVVVGSDALSFEAASVRRISNEVLGALVRAAIYRAAGRGIDDSLLLACDGDVPLYELLRAYMREQPELAMNSLRGAAA